MWGISIELANFLLAIGNDKAFLRQQKYPSCFTIVWIFRTHSPVISNENRFASVQFSNTMTGVIPIIGKQIGGINMSGCPIALLDWQFEHGFTAMFLILMFLGPTNLILDACI